MSILVGKGQPLLLILSVNTGFLAIFLEGRLSFFRQMSWICLMLVLANPGTRRFRLRAVKVGVFVRWVLMSLRVSSVTLPWFIPDPIFRFLTGSNGLASAWAKTRFRVAFDMLSCSLMFLRGTLAFHNSFFPQLYSHSLFLHGEVGNRIGSRLSLRFHHLLRSDVKIWRGPIQILSDEKFSSEDGEIWCAAP